MEWRPIELNLGPLPSRGTAQYSLVSIYHGVARYRETFLQGRLSTNRLYREFCRRQAGTPSLNAVLRVAPLRALLEEVERPGWEERVQVMPDPRKPPRDEAELARRRHDRLLKRAEKSSPQRVLEIVRGSQPVTVRSLRDELGWPITRVRYYLRLLRDAGLIEFTAPTQSKSQAYRPRRVVRADADG
jgi:hypothetical protein